ncbi:MAG: cytochrome c [Sphingomonas sp.]
MRTAFLVLSFGLLATQVVPTLAKSNAKAPAIDVKALRLAAMGLSSGTVNDASKAVKFGAPVKNQAYAARALAKWARIFPILFPKGSDTPNTRPEIWTDRTGFEGRAATLATAADELARLADADDAAGFATQIVVVRTACGECHDSYRAK